MSECDGQSHAKLPQKVDCERMTNDSTNSDKNLLKGNVRVLEKLLWQLPRKVVIDLLLELRSQLTDADTDALEKRISELVATKEDRKRA